MPGSDHETRLLPGPQQAAALPELFQFERRGKLLGRIPMAVRWKLDQCGLKIGLRAWSRLDFAERAELVGRPCASQAQREQYRLCLFRLVAESELEVIADSTAPGGDEQALFDRCAAYLRTHRGVTLDLATWRSLNGLQRFALGKLTREGHKNTFLEDVLLEIGLQSAAAGMAGSASRPTPNPVSPAAKRG